MPTYEYECRRCAKVFEAFQSITARPLQRCPDCKGPVRRLIGRGSGIIFKGSGFYQTDYRSDHYKKRAAEDKSTAALPAADAKKTATGAKTKGAAPAKQAK